MMNIRVVLFSSALVAATIACSAPSGERHARTEQRIEVTPLVGDAAAETCTHAICATGAALTTSCDPCTTLLCAQDPYCCSTTWDATCVGEVGSICGQSCSVTPDADAGASTCAHPVCAAGEPLASTCDSCATLLCAQDPYCCAVSWDATCVSEVAGICGQACN